MKKIWITIMLLSFMQAVLAADVYKWVDAEGHVHFTDDPNHPGAEKIHVAPPPTYTPPPLPKIVTSPEPRKQPATAGYATFAISSPENEATIWDNNGTLTVSVSLSPPLRQDLGHQLVYLLDGSEVGRSGNTTFTLSGIERGTHQLAVELEDDAGRVLQSDQITFYLHRRSLLDQSGEVSGQAIPRAKSAPRAPQAPRR